MICISVFCIVECIFSSENVSHALTAAVMLEDSAKVYYLTRTIGKPEELPEEEIKRANELFKNVYGQK